MDNYYELMSIESKVGYIKSTVDDIESKVGYIESTVGDIESEVGYIDSIKSTVGVIIPCFILIIICAYFCIKTYKIAKKCMKFQTHIIEILEKQKETENG